jgi:DNA-binding PadR family transcriptional regulator
MKNIHIHSSKEHLSLELYILSCLEGGSRPIITIQKELEQDYGLLIEPGMLIKTLARMEQHGWTYASQDDLYHLTDTGESMLYSQRDALYQRNERIGVAPRLQHKEKYMRPINWLLRLYPQSWRKRYEGEMLALLEQHTVTLTTFFDLLLGALDARLDPAYKTERGFFLFKNKFMIAMTFLCAFAIFLFTSYSYLHYTTLALTSDLLQAMIRPTPIVQMIDLPRDNTQTWASLGGNNPFLWQSPQQLGNFVTFITLLASNLFIITRQITHTNRPERKAFLIPALSCILLFLMLPATFLLGDSQSMALYSPSGVIWYLERVRTFQQIAALYLWNFNEIWLPSSLLLTSLFIAFIVARKVRNTSHKLWPLLAVFFYLILPISQMLWFNNGLWAVAIASGSVVSLLAYFPVFSGLGAIVLVFSNSIWNQRMWRIALIPATLLALTMLIKLATIMSLGSSGIPVYSARNILFPDFTAITMLFVMIATTGITLIALMRGFIALKNGEPDSQTETASPLTQSAHRS